MPSLVAAEVTRLKFPGKQSLVWSLVTSAAALRRFPLGMGILSLCKTPGRCSGGSADRRIFQKTPNRLSAEEPLHRFCGRLTLVQAATAASG